jgi:hypothetical protein
LWGTSNWEMHKSFWRLRVSRMGWWVGKSNKHHHRSGPSRGLSWPEAFCFCFTMLWCPPSSAKLV